MATISGIYNDPFGRPVSGAVIELTARKTTSATFAGTNAAAVTAEDGSYTMIVLPGVYVVTSRIKTASNYLGVIYVYPEGPDASLNQYLASFNPDDVTPAILEEIQELARSAESSAQAAAELVRHPIFEVPTAAELPAVPAGFYMVKNDEGKGGGPQLYYFSAEDKYWIAMVKEAR